jgi:hypothetical protein
MTTPVSIEVAGNVEGSIVVGDHNFVVNTNHGTIVYQQAAPQVRPRTLKPQPPRAPRGFLNRAAELGKLEAWIGQNEIVLLHAPDGLGKSALLRQAAHTAAAGARADGVLLLEGQDVSGAALGPGDILQRLFDALFESNPPLKVDAASARTYLSNTRPLVLLDEVALTPALQTLLPDLFPQGAILLTADTPAGADFQRLPLKPLPRAEALLLLAEKAALTVNDANRPSLDSLCALLDDLPLALAVTGNLLRETATPPDAALAALQNLPETSPDPLQAALDRAFAFALGKLGPEEQKTLAAAALTPGVSMSPDWLESALGQAGISHFIERLKALGLLYANSPRLRLPAGFRAPARQAAQGLLDEQTLLRQLAEFLLARLSANPFDWAAIEEELGNLTGVLRTGDEALALRLARLLAPYLTLRGLWDAWERTLQRALQAARAGGDRAAEGWALHELGSRALGLGDKTAALALLKQALALRQQIGDQAGAAFTRHNLRLLAPPPPPKPRLSPGKILLGLGGAAVMLAGAVILGLLLLTPAKRDDPAGPPIERIYAEYPYLVYGPNAADCGRTSSQVVIVTSGPDIRPAARYRYSTASQDLGEWRDLPLEHPELDIYIGAVNTAEAAGILVNNPGTLTVEVLVEGDQEAVWFDIQRVDCSPTPTPTPQAVDEEGPVLDALDFTPNPSLYGPQADACGGSELTLSLTAVDPGGVESVSVRYRYEYGDKLVGEWREAAMSLTGTNAYTLVIDHNENDQALNVLDNLPGVLRWEVTAVDKLGYKTSRAGPPAPLDYARCESSAPRILRPYTSPNPAYYGPNSCPERLDSEIHAFVIDESGLQRVYVEYNYETGDFRGPTYVLDLALWGGDDHYGVFIEHNFENRAGGALDTNPGYMRWVVAAIDRFGNTARGKENLAPISFCVAPG